MIKRLYLADGKLLQPLDKSSDDVAVDSSIVSLLQANLVQGDHCYLTLVEGNKLEVIKVEQVATWYEVTRAQSGTERNVFSLNAKIVYTLTDQEVRDAVEQKDFVIYPDGYGAIEVGSKANSWTLKYADLAVSGLGGLTILQPDIYNVVIADNNGMFGCCDGNVTGAPFAGGQFFYLTSQLYAMYLSEIALTGSPKDKNGLPIPPLSGEFNWRLLGETFGEQEIALAGSLVMGDINVFNSALNYTCIEQYLNPTVKFFDVNIFDVVKTAGMTEELSGTAYVLEVLTFGSQVQFSTTDMYLKGTLSNIAFTVN